MHCLHGTHHDPHHHTDKEADGRGPGVGDAVQVEILLLLAGEGHIGHHSVQGRVRGHIQGRVEGCVQGRVSTFHQAKAAVGHADGQLGAGRLGTSKPDPGDNAETTEVIIIIIIIIVITTIITDLMNPTTAPLCSTLLKMTPRVKRPSKGPPTTPRRMRMLSLSSSVNFSLQT